VYVSHHKVLAKKPNAIKSTRMNVNEWKYFNLKTSIFCAICSVLLLKFIGFWMKMKNYKIQFKLKKHFVGTKTNRIFFRNNF
jgi:hypothetical protein